MSPRDPMTRKVHAALEREPRINIHRHPIRIDSRDRLRIAPGEPRGDGTVRDSFVRRLLEQAEFRNCTVRLRTNEKVVSLREANADGVGEVEVSVTDGVIVLEGHVISVPHRLFAGVLAWWTPGRRDVVNALELEPSYEERDEEVTEALRLALEADPLLEAGQVRAVCRNWIVTLEGAVPTEEQRRRAELDAWSLSGVDRVVNRLRVSG